MLPDVYGHDLDLNLLRVFAVVADEGSITRAASRLYVTQPAVSAAMRRLSAFVGTDLFTRQGRGVVLSSRGAELLVAARAHLLPLIAATAAAAPFDPTRSTAIVRLGLADSMEALLLPALLARLERSAPDMQLVVVRVQFRSVEEQLLSSQVDVAVTVADELPRSILREPLLVPPDATAAFVCMYDSRFLKLPKLLTEATYFAHHHVAVSYAGDLRGLVEDSTGRTRRIRASIPSLSNVGEAIDGSTLLATVPAVLARHLCKTRPHLKTRRLPFVLEPSTLEMLWRRSHDGDEAQRFVRAQLRLVAKR